MKAHLLFPCILVCGIFLSCSPQLSTSTIAYQSIRSDKQLSSIPDSAMIGIAYSFTSEGALVCVVKNYTDEILTIDQTRSFLIEPSGTSIPFYDPNMTATSTTEFSANSIGGAYGLSGVTGALKLTQTLSSILGGFSFNFSHIKGHAVTHTTIMKESPQISIAAKSHGALPKCQYVKGVGISEFVGRTEQFKEFNKEQAECKFSVTLTFSFDNGKTYQSINTPFFVSSIAVSNVKEHGKLNDALRSILTRKPDAIYEQWWMLFANDNKGLNDNLVQGVILDYK